MPNQRRFPWIFAFGILVGSQYARGEVFVLGAETTDQPTNIQLYGEITRADTVKIAAAIRNSAPKHNLSKDLVLNLDSSGGDVEAAMAIGRLIRMKTTEIHVVMPLPIPGPLKNGQAVCASACVLILVAGSTRNVFSYTHERNIGIHRPYSTTPIGPKTDTRAAYNAVAARVKAYLEEMGVPSGLYEAMMRVPSENMRWLSSDDLVDLGIVGTDAAYQDLQDSRAAAAHGISKQEWLRRKGLSFKACVPILMSAALAGPLYSDPTYKKFLLCIEHIEDTGSI